MRSGAISLLLLLVASGAGAQQSHTIKVHESRTFQVFGATAAWAVDGAVVDAAAQNGTVTVFGRAAGRTRVVIVSITGENALEIQVVSQTRTSAPSRKEQETRATAEARYTSATRETQATVAATQHRRDGRDEIQLRTSHHLQAPAGDRARTSIQGATLRMFRGARELTIFDREVDHSPLTLSSTPLRGIHYVDAAWRLHAGYTTYTAYDSLFIPVQRELVAGAAYAVRASPRSTVTPGIFTYRGRGSAASVIYDFARDETTTLRAELGYSHGIGGAVQFSTQTARDLLRANLRYRPASFARTTAAGPAGLLGDALWNRTYGRGSALSATASVSDVATMRVLGASADLDHRLTDIVSLTAGASWGRFGARSSLMLPAGIRADFARGGVGAIYRHARSSENDGGHGARIFGRTTMGRFSASGYADWQQNAPTLDLIFRDAPELALALDELGITATSPADIARALRDHATLAELGFIDGVTVDLSPVRRQYGLELAWLGAGASRQTLRLRFARSETEGVASGTKTTLAALAYAQHFRRNSELYASYTWWKSDVAGEPAHVQPYFEAGIRQQFDSLPSIGGSGAISGTVFADEDLDGQSDGSPVLAEIELDGSRSTRTAADGSFVFANVPSGSHRLAVRVPERPEAYFTTPSRVEASPGDRIAFGVASTPARLIGRISSDADEGIEGVRIVLSRGTSQFVSISDSSGAYTFAAAPGEWQLAILSDSVAAGYSLRGLEPKPVVLSRSTPLHVSQTLHANRSIAGTGARAGARIRIPSLGKTIEADAEGRFAFRGLPPGKIRILAGDVSYEVDVPTAPARVVVELMPAAARAPTPRIITSGERRDRMQWVVQIGAFRVRANAIDARSRANLQGVNASIDTDGPLAIVRAGPYASRGEADRVAALLTQAGLDTAILSSK